MVLAIRGKAVRVTCFTMMITRTRLLSCRAFIMRTSAGSCNNLRGNMHRRGMIGVWPSLSSAPRPAPGLASRCFGQPRFFLSASAGGAASNGESPSSPPPPWPNLRDESTSPPTPVSVDEYVALGPRYRREKNQIHRRRLRRETEDWAAAAADLAASLGLDPRATTDAQHRRIFHLYLPVYFWLRELVRATNRRWGCSTGPPPRSSTAPVVVGMSAPQGCGKTTLVSEMQRMLENAGYSCAVVSIDDFYLTGAEQVNLLHVEFTCYTSSMCEVFTAYGAMERGLLSPQLWRVRGEERQPAKEHTLWSKAPTA